MLKTFSCLNVGVALLLLAALPAAQAEPVAATGFTHVKALGGIDEYRLDANGLTVLIKPDHSAPVVTFQVTYHVGSRNEVTGTTGATHILEHMMFKGSEHYNKPAANGVDQYLAKVGARFNASTSYDRTNYFATLGRDSLEGYIAIEADRMRQLWLREADRQKEMTVVRNEFEQGENNPGSALEKEIWATAYQAQPYHHPVIGWRSDIEQVPIEKLRQFYDTFYWPDNATVSVIGDVQPLEALSLVNKYYGAIPHSPRAIPEVYTEEPPQRGARRVALRRAGAPGVVDIAWKAPAGRDSDLPALSVLGGILSAGANSRLSRALVDKSLVTTTAADIDPMHDPALFVAGARLTPGTTHEQVEGIILAEIDKVKRQGVTSEEVQRVISQYRADQSFGRDGTASIAGELNEWIAVGDWTLFVTNIDKIAKVTPVDVQRVANTYLKDDQSTTGWFVPAVEK